MKVLHVPFTYYPDPCGGTEVYVAALCRGLRETGLESAVAAPTAEASSTYEFEEVRVHRFQIHPSPSLEMLYGAGDPVAAANFGRILDTTDPGLVHFHALSPAVSVLCLEEAKKRGIPSVFTYHTPTASCQRGTLMRWGRRPCDGLLRSATCTACALQGNGLPQPLAWALTGLGPLAAVVGRLQELPRPWRTALLGPALIMRRLQATRTWWQGMETVVALCEWTRQLLLRNGVAGTRIQKVRHGLVPTLSSATSEPYASGPVRLAFLGRMDRIKGIDLLIEALRLIAGLPVTLDLYAIAQAGGDAGLQSLIAQAQHDPRIQFKRPVCSSEVIFTLQGYHALAVPSRGLETGPLVVLEAFAAGIPVIGSNLGGIPEWITHERDGLLVAETTPQAWSRTLRRLVDEPGLLPRLRSGIQPPRTMNDVAAEMSLIYHAAQERMRPA